MGGRWGEGSTLQYMGIFYLQQARYDVALAYLLLARDIFAEAQRIEGDLPQKNIETLQQKVGDEEFASLLAKVEPQAAEIVGQALGD